jgi:hypothetical protein
MIAAGWKQGPPPLLKSGILQMMGVAPVPGAVMGVSSPTAAPGARIYDRIVTNATGHDHPALFRV